MRDPADPKDRYGDPSYGDPLLRNPVDSLAQVLRGGVLVVMALLLVIAIYYALAVFSQIQTVITQPENIETAVGEMATLIDADNLTVQLRADDEPFKPGRVLAMTLLLLWYCLWAWIPIAIISACGRVLLTTMKRSAGRADDDNDR